MIMHILDTPEIFDLHNIIIIFEHFAHQIGWRSEPPLPAVLNGGGDNLSTYLFHGSAKSVASG